MLKALAALRTVFLVFIVAFTIRAMPWNLEVPRTHDEQYARVANAVSQLQRACWYAVGWIAFDTLASWFLATRRRAPAAPPAAREPASPAPRA